MSESEHDIAKWMFIAALYDLVSQQQIKLGRILSREEFMKHAIIVATTPEAIADIAAGPYPVQFVNVRVAGTPPLPGRPLTPPNGIIRG